MKDIKIDLRPLSFEGRETARLLLNCYLDLDWMEENNIAVVYPDGPDDVRILQFIFHDYL